jgi:hypothetical protein
VNDEDSIDESPEFLPLFSKQEEDESNKMDVPDELPVLAIKNTVLFPGVIFPITVGRDKSIKLIKDANKKDNIIAVVSQKNSNVEDPTIDDLNKIGTLAKIIKVMRMPDGTTTVIIQGKRRVVLGDFVAEEPYFRAKVTSLTDELFKGEKDKEYKAIIDSIKDISYCGIEYEYVEPDYEAVAKLIADGKIVGWFMGASECGPRALGNRSILADPRNFHNRELINFTIKRREWFRPLAPSVLEEECSKWFDFDGISPYMLYTAKVLKPELLPAITHIDGTARMQTVNEETNPAYYKLIKKFYEITGIPMVLNTSLNGMNEPILETEEDAMEFFKKSSIDAMVISGKLYTKE